MIGHDYFKQIYRKKFLFFMRYKCLFHCIKFLILREHATFEAFDLRLSVIRIIILKFYIWRDLICSLCTCIKTNLTLHNP